MLNRFADLAEAVEGEAGDDVFDAAMAHRNTPSGGDQPVVTRRGRRVRGNVWMPAITAVCAWLYRRTPAIEQVKRLAPVLAFLCAAPAGLIATDSRHHSHSR
jgi:hypothetical protein